MIGWRQALRRTWERHKSAWRERRAAERTSKTEVVSRKTEQRMRQTAGQTRRNIVGVVVGKIAQRKWLVPLFAAGAVVFFALGYSLHRSAEPPDVAAVQRGSQVVDLSIFTSNPTEYVALGVFVDVSTTSATYTLNVTLDPGAAPYDVLITSSIPDATHLFRKMIFNLDNFVGVDSPNLYYYVATSPSVSADVADQKVKFNLPSGSFLDTKGALVARMPTIGLQDNLGTMYFGSPKILAGSGGGALDIDPVYLKPGHPLYSESPDDYDVTRNDVGVIYAPPDTGKFQSNVSFTDATYGMAGAQIQANSPSNGVFKDQSFQWASGDAFGLAPYLSLVQPTALDQRSSDDFLSGIFLASAAAAVIAFLQEVPDAAKNSTLLARRSTKTAKLGDPAQPDTAASASEHRDDPSPETESRSASDLGCRLPDKSSAHLSPFAADRAGAGGVTTVCAAIVGLYWAWRRFR